MSLLKQSHNPSGHTSQASSDSQKVKDQMDGVQNSVVSVFEHAIIKKATRHGPVFYEPKSKMNDPFADIFIRARTGFVAPSSSEFVYANRDIPEEPHVFKGRKLGDFGLTDYLLRSC